MCSKAVIFVVLCLIVDYAAGYAIREKSKNKQDFSAYLRTLAGYQQRLQIQGLYPKLKMQNSHDSTRANAPNFDELEVLQLIPVTIKQLRQGQLTSDERLALQKIFGNIWGLIVEDSRRKKSEPRNPVLSVLLSSREIRLGSQEIRQQLDNDVQGNSIQMVFNPENSKPIQLSDDIGVEPSQRLLRMVAAIVQKAYKDGVNRKPSNTPQKVRSKRSNSINLDNVQVTIHMPRAKRSLFASKSIKNSASLTPEERRRIEEANEAAIMAAVLAQIGGNSLDDGEDDEEDDYYEEDDYPEHELLEAGNTIDEADEEEIDDLAGEEEEEDEEGDDIDVQAAGGFGMMPSLDYAYDDTGDSDDYFLNDFKPRFSPGQFENPSINELIMLAARHRSKKRSEVRTANPSHFLTASDEYVSDY